MEAFAELILKAVMMYAASFAGFSELIVIVVSRLKAIPLFSGISGPTLQLIVTTIAALAAAVATHFISQEVVVSVIATVTTILAFFVGQRAMTARSTRIYQEAKVDEQSVYGYTRHG